MLLSCCICVTYGTRPELIKLTPVVEALRERDVSVVEWRTNQSADLVDGDQRIGWTTMHGGIAAILRSMPLEGVDVVVVQGDTASAFACALAAWLQGVDVAHVEAGMRTYRDTPWPEEAFRRMIAPLARWHFAPDEIARDNLRREGVPAERIHVVGNTIIDTLPSSRLRVFATLHRRENWGAPIRDALGVLGEADCDVTIPRHPNWFAARIEPFMSSNIDYRSPMSRDETLAEIRAANLIVTDSGGIQEEAAHFGKPCLVYRDATERKALEAAEAVYVIGAKPELLREALEHEIAKRRCYGDGRAAERIADVLARDVS